MAQIKEIKMIWIKRMLLGGFVVNLIYILFMFILPGLSIVVYTLISGLITGLLLLFLVKKGHI